MRLFFLSLVIFSWSLAAPAQTDDQPVVLVVGDSISAAYGMELAESWPSLLQARLHEHGLAYRVFNSSITGDTTQSGLARLPRLLQLNPPAVVIIELGGNDGLRGLPLDVTEANLRAMIEHSQSSGARVVLAGIQIPPNYGKTYTEKFNQMYRQLAEIEGVELVPFILDGVALDPQLMQEDGIHPRAEAQPILLDNVWPAVQAALR